MSGNTAIEQLLKEAWAERRSGNYEAARTLTDQALDRSQSRDHYSLGRIFHVYMQFEYDHRHYAKALEFCRRSLSHYEKSGNSDKVAHAIRHMADIQQETGSYGESEKNYKKAIDIYRTNSDTGPGDLANCLRGYALVLEKLNRLEEARNAWKEARMLYETCHLEAGIEEADGKLKSLQI